MTIETIFLSMLMLATFFCMLATGFILIFAIVVMPGIGTLDDRSFLRAFQVIDRVIQNNQPLFGLIWVGSVVAILAATFLGFSQLDDIGRILILAAAILYIFGMQLPTISINIPLNNRLQTLNLETMDETTAVDERQRFEARWNRWNTIRTGFSSVASILLLIVVQLI